MNDEIRLLIQVGDERTAHRRREAFLTSVVLHLLLIILILVGPQLFPKNALREPTRRDLNSIESSKQLGFVAPPKDYQKLLQKPKTPILSDKDRIAQGKAPKIDPKGLRAPYSEGETKVPEQAAPQGTPEPPIPPQVASPSGGQPAPPQTLPDETKQIAKLQLPQKPISPAGETRPSLRDLVEGMETPGFSIKNSIEKARQAGNYGSGGFGDAPRNFDNRQANFSVEEPTVLTDTHGVDFGGWLRLVYFRVRDNWYSVIPEVIRSGTKGKVVVIFDVRSNGLIENLQVVRSSGLSPYDRAAVSSLKLSEPFPNFPPAFKGEFITLQFSYLYNMRL
jgi:TonB family protein